MSALYPPLNNSRESNVSLSNFIYQRLLVRLTDSTLLRQLSCSEVLGNVFQGASRQDRAEPMSARVLRQNDAVFKVCGHVFCADERGDGIGDVVDEEDWVFGFGLLEA
jgi:hypothetical protein